MDSDPDHSPPRKRARTSEDAPPSAFPAARSPPADVAFLAANDARLGLHPHQHQYQRHLQHMQEPLPSPPPPPPPPPQERQQQEPERQQEHGRDQEQEEGGEQEHQEQQSQPERLQERGYPHQRQEQEQGEQTQAQTQTQEQEQPQEHSQEQQEQERLAPVDLAPFLMMSLRGRTDGAHVASGAGPAPGSLEATVSSDEPMSLALRIHDAAAPSNAAEESTTDDEELQQLSMVKLDEGAIEAGELNYDDVKTVVFSAAKDPRLSTLQKSMRMIKAASNGAEVMRRLVQAEDETGLTLLMIGVKNNLLPFCGFLLDEGADVNYNSEKRTYALLLAAQKGWEEMTKFLLDRGANDESKNMSLIPAAHFGHLAVVSLLLERGADLNYANKKGTTPLMRAAQEGRDNVVQFFIDRGVDTCAANNEGMTALMLAAQRGHAHIAATLIRSGSNVNKQTRQGSTALLLAAKRGHTAAVEALMTAGADIFLKDDRDKTAADTAQRRGHVDLCLKITVANQLRLMREYVRRERCFTMMHLSTLYVLGRAELTPSFKNPQRRRYNELMDRTMRLPKPLVQNIARFLPLCRMWDRQLRYLIYETSSQSNRVVQQGIRIIDEILLSFSLEMRPSLKRIKEECGGPLHVSGQLALLRDSSEYRSLFTTESRLPMPPMMLLQLRRMADIQGAIATYSAGNAIQFGVEVAQDVVALLSDLLNWDTARKRAELLQ